MSFSKTYRLMITPQQQVLISQGEKWLMADGITDQYLISLGEKKNREQTLKGAKSPIHPNYYLNKRNRYRRYYDYKKALRLECQKQKLFPQTKNFWVKFYIPMPESWSKKKKNKLAFELHEQTPDNDNFCKAFFDSIFDKKDDKKISDYRASKFWAPTSFGFIDVELGTLPPAKGYTTVFTDELR
jgi:Holliday junction resolvase RusA-like endonuclease